MTLQILPAGAITAGVYVRITADTLQDLVDSTDEEIGKARFAFALAFDQPNGVLSNVRLTMRLSIAMPVWTKVAQRPQPERDEWNRFLRALRAHEDGHIAIFRAEAPTTYRRLTESTPDTINEVLAGETARIEGLSDAYDLRTDHGRTQQTPHGTTEIQVPP